MNALSLIPRGGKVVVQDADGNEVATISAEQAQAMMGGQGTGLQTAGQAVQAVGSALQYRDLRNLRDDARDARWELKDAQTELKNYLKKAGTAVSGPDLSALLSDVYDRQRDVDQTQNDLIGTIQDNLIIQLAGQGLQLAGSLSGAGMPDLGGGAGTLIAGIGAGALLLSVFDDEDDRRGRRGRRLLRETET